MWLTGTKVPADTVKTKKGPIRIIFFIVGFNVVVDQRVTVAPNFTHFNILKLHFPCLVMHHSSDSYMFGVYLLSCAVQAEVVAFCTHHTLTGSVGNRCCSWNKAAHDITTFPRRFTYIKNGTGMYICITALIWLHLDKREEQMTEGYSLSSD